ncbi:MAG: hypothetical protein ABI667_03880 [Sphingomicrobium sp.]
MNPFEFVLAIVFIVTIGNVLRAKHRGKGLLSSRRDRRDPLGFMGDDDQDSDNTSAENRRLIEEVQQLKDRVKVLERIAVDKEDTLSRQIEELRDR